VLKTPKVCAIHIQIKISFIYMLNLWFLFFLPMGSIYKSSNLISVTVTNKILSLVDISVMFYQD
jgi:hypothetical protein